MSQEGERQIEMLWRCSSCGHKNLGRFGECQGCRNPKDGSEEWEMPPDTAAAPSVTDPELLRLALAGADWRCAFCGSDQRALDGACRSCGAKQADGKSLADPKAPPVPLVTPAVDKAVTRAGYGCLGFLGLTTAAMLGAVLLCLGGAVYLMFRTPWRDVDATVSQVRWEHRVVVERLAEKDFEGFAESKPAGARAVREVGQREHHREDVFDHMTTEHYTEQVPDGTRTEHYTEHVRDGVDHESTTERERCGEDCETEPKRCQEKCTSNKNGFATCKTTCTGGGRHCEPKYCDRTRTRDVPRYKDVDRTRQVPKYRDVDRTRQVPVYRSEPRFAPWYAWRALTWGPNRTVRAEGTTTETRWPSEAEVKAGVTLAPGEEERSSREATYDVTLSAGGSSYDYVPSSLEDFQRFGVGSRHRLRLEDGKLLAVDPAPAQ